MHFSRKIAAISIAASMLPVAAAFSTEKAASVPVVRGEVIRDFARVTFEWPRSVYISAKSEANTITVSFDHKANPDFGKLLAALSPYVSSAEVSKDGKTIRLSMNQHYRVRSFTSGNISGVDILGIDPSQKGKAPKKAEAKAKPEPEQPAKEPETEVAEQPEVPAIEPNTEAPPEPKAEVAEKPAPTAEKAAAKTQAKPTTPEKTAETENTATQEKSVVTAKAKQSATPTLPEPSKSVKAMQEASVRALAPSAGEELTEAPPVAEKNKTAEKPAEKPTDSAPPPPAEPAALTPEEEASIKKAAAEQAFTAPAAANSEAVKVFASTSSGKTVLRFVWKERVAAAAFVRSNRVWIVFNKQLPLDLSAVQETADSLYPNIKQYKVDGATVLSIRSNELRGILPTKAPDSFEWSMVMVGTPQAPTDKMRIDISTDAPLPAHVFIPATELADSITLEDPDMGDSLLVIPSYKAGEGISPRRNFVEFSLLESAQGLVVKRIADSVSITQTRNGLRLGSEKGSPLSPNLPDIENKEKQPEQKSEAPPEIALPSATASAAVAPAPSPATGLLFPYEEWKAKPKPSLVEQIQELQQEVIQSANPASALKVHMRLAQLYLAEGLDVEALGVLHEIRRKNPEFFIAQRLSALTGACNFLLHRFGEAAQDFSGPELQGNPETKYWQSMLNELLGKDGQTYNYLDNNVAYFSKYPPRMRQQLAIVAADRAVAKGEHNVALQVLDTLKGANQLHGVEDYAAFLLAKISIETDKEAEGVEILNRLASNYQNPSVRARAEFALISNELKKQPKDPSEFLPRLERLNASWRGDDLEMETLKIIAELHFLNDDYALAMRAWRDLITGFPSTIAATEALSRMRSTFVTLFDGNAADSLSPIDQLSVYYEFRSLTPGDEVGDRIVTNIAERLVGIDLLEQAITLLDYRMRYLYEKDVRSRTGARLAEIYLLNRQPEKAIETLQASAYGDNPRDLRIHRDELTASAMVEMRQYKDAMELLEGNQSKDAEAIRQRAWWKQKDWPRLITSVETELKGRQDITAPMNAAETEKLVQLALAYVAESDTTQLQYLRDYFTPLLKENPRLELFDFITEPELMLKPEMLDALMTQIEKTRTFLKDYKAMPASLAKTQASEKALKEQEKTEEANALKAAEEAAKDLEKRRKAAGKRESGQNVLDEVKD